MLDTNWLRFLYGDIINAGSSGQLLINEIPVNSKQYISDTVKSLFRIFGRDDSGIEMSQVKHYLRLLLLVPIVLQGKLKWISKVVGHFILHMGEISDDFELGIWQGSSFILRYIVSSHIERKLVSNIVFRCCWGLWWCGMHWNDRVKISCAGMLCA